MKTLRSIAILVVLVSPLRRVSHWPSTKPAPTSSAARRAYQSFCANCHGAAGNQVANVDIGRGVFRRPYSDDDLTGIAMRGIPGTPMPATPNINREQATQVVAYLRSRVRGGGRDGRWRCRARPGALFAGTGQCFTCHRVQGEGSRRGPDLSRIGVLRTPDQLARSLLDPDAEVQPANRTYRVELRNGRKVTGRLLNQDAYSVQLLTDDEELRSFQKADLTRHGFVPSPMPSMRGKWNDRQAGGCRALPCVPARGHEAMRFRALLIAAIAIMAAEACRHRSRRHSCCKPDATPADWLSYSRDYSNQRHSPLDAGERAQRRQPRTQVGLAGALAGEVRGDPLVVGGVLYTVQAPNDVVALDAATGRIFWTYSHAPSPARTCCGRVNRGLAIVGDTLFMGTVDAHLLAIDAKNGQLLWDTVVADASQQYSITMPPMVVKDKVMIGVAGGDMGIRGFVAAFDVKSGRELWKFHTIPAPGEAGNETWSGDSWQAGGAAIWNHGAYDPAANLVYWGTGNPAPDWDGRTRLGDNLYSDSVIALDADTGKLRWHYQFTPHDELDYDSTAGAGARRPCLAGQAAQADALGESQRRDVCAGSPDRRVPEGKPYVEVNWLTGFDAKGVRNARRASCRRRRARWCGRMYTAPSIGRRRHSVRAPACFTWRTGSTRASWRSRASPAVGGHQCAPDHHGRRARSSPSSTMTTKRRGVIRAMRPATLAPKWELRARQHHLRRHAVHRGGLWCSPAARTGISSRLDARTGKLLWRASLGGQVNAGAMTYAVDGKRVRGHRGGLGVVVFTRRRYRIHQGASAMPASRLPAFADSHHAHFHRARSGVADWALAAQGGGRNGQGQ